MERIIFQLMYKMQFKEDKVPHNMAKNTDWAYRYLNAGGLQKMQNV